MWKTTAIILIINVILVDISGQSCLEEGIVFIAQEEIDSFSSNYPDCIHVEGDIGITGDSITDLRGLSNLITVGGNFDLYYTGNLTSLYGLNNLTSIEGSLRFVKNEVLKSTEGLEMLTAIGGDLKILESDILTGLKGLSGLKTIGGDLQIATNDSLVSLSGLDNLVSVGGALKVMGNNALKNLTGLEGLTSIGTNVYIGYTTLGNSAFTSLKGIENIDATTILDLRIESNVALADCDVKSVCDYLDSPNGPIIIDNNATGCNSREEIEEECALSLEENNRSAGITVSPNPACEYVIFRFLNFQSQRVIIRIYDVQGTEIALVLDEKLSAGEHSVTFNTKVLPAGLYVYRKSGSGDQESEMGKLFILR